MVTYCTGNIAAKRRAFRAVCGISSASADNDEVLATFTLNKKLYVLSGTIPFSNTRLGQFVAYSRALKSSLPVRLNAVKEVLKTVGVKKSVYLKMGALCAVDYRAAVLASKIDIATKDIYVNFDGLKFSRRNRKKIMRYVRIWSKIYNVYIAVSDSRFIPPKARVLHYDAIRMEEKRLRGISRTVSVRTLRRRLKKSGMEMNIPHISAVVVCDAL